MPRLKSQYLITCVTYESIKQGLYAGLLQFAFMLLGTLEMYIIPLASLYEGSNYQKNEMVLCFFF